MFTKNKNLIDDSTSMVDVVEHDNGNFVLITIIFHNSIYKKQVHQFIELYNSNIGYKHGNVRFLTKKIIESFHIKEAYHLANDICISFEINKNHKSENWTFDDLHDYAINGDWGVILDAKDGVISSIDLIEK